MKSNQELTAASAALTQNALELSDDVAEAATLLLASAYNLVVARYGHEQAEIWLKAQAQLKPLDPPPPCPGKGLH
ncbi:hypothetical protein [Marinobacter sp. DUT-1]|uniref:hypothetical protein n=1 Tax=Marinobacter sp. DUT-1 TaxID=3412037 RepID=UPI003D16E025